MESLLKMDENVISSFYCLAFFTIRFHFILLLSSFAVIFCCHLFHQTSQLNNCSSFLVLKSLLCTFPLKPSNILEIANFVMCFRWPDLISKGWFCLDPCNKIEGIFILDSCTRRGTGTQGSPWGNFGAFRLESTNPSIWIICGWCWRRKEEED